MIGWPRTEAEHAWFRAFLLERGAAAITPEAHILAWIKDGLPRWVVAYDQWCGQTCQMHWASFKAGFLPREFRYFCFTYAFINLGLKRVFGQVDSNNRAALELDKWLGFREVYRAEGCHTSGGDLVFIEMRADECKWIRKTDEQKQPAHS